MTDEDRIELALEADRRTVGYVYGVGCGRTLIKVGRAVNLDSRMKSLIIGNPFELHMRYCIKAWHGYLPEIERWLHLRLKKQHVRHEWFSGKPATFDAAFAEALKQFPAAAWADRCIGLAWPGRPCRPIRPTEEAEQELGQQPTSRQY